MQPCKRRYGTFTMMAAGLTVRYRSLSEAEFSAFEMDSLKQTDDGLRTDEERLEDARQRLIVLCLCDGDGAQLLNAGDVEAVSQWDAGDTAALYDVLREHCGIAKRVRDAAKKNLRARDATSPTGSPGGSE